MLSTLINNLWMLRSIYRYSPGRYWAALGTVLCGTLEGIIFNLLFLPFIYNAIGEEYTIEKTLTWCIGMIVILIVCAGYRTYRDQLIIPKSNLSISYGLQTALFERTKKIKLSTYDEPDFYNKYMWTVNDMETRAVSVLNSMTDGLEHLIMFVIVCSITLIFDPRLFVLALIPALMTAWIGRRIHRIQFKHDEGRNRYIRVRDYVKRVMYLPQYAKELRMYRIQSVLLRSFHSAMAGLESITYTFGQKIGGWRAVQDIAVILFSQVLALGYLAYQALVEHRMDVGTVILLSNALWQIGKRMTILSQVIPLLQQNSSYIQLYREFVENEDWSQSDSGSMIPVHQSHAIELKDVSFSYDGNHDVLKNLNLSIRKGERVAIVGSNGAGKSTLIKLILRLYEATTGEIYLDGNPAKEYSLSCYQKRFGVLFQDFQIYAASLAENIKMDVMNDSMQEQESLNQAIKHAGLESLINQWPTGIYSKMTKEFNDEGLHLSGGQLQKLALARLFKHEYGVLILDEPSSALDPVSEEMMFRTIVSWSTNKTMILISHRLSVMRDVDRIIMMDEGQIVEQGSHCELMELNGKYAYMYRLQANAYH